MRQSPIDGRPGSLPAARSLPLPRTHGPRRAPVRLRRCARGLAGPRYRHHGHARLPPPQQCEHARRLLGERADRRPDRRGPAGRIRSAGVRPRRDRLRAERHHPALLHLAIARANAPTRGRDPRHPAGPRREHPPMAHGRRRRGRHRPMGRRAARGRDARPGLAGVGALGSNPARRVHTRLQRRGHDHPGARDRPTGSPGRRPDRIRRRPPRPASIDRRP
jgi:hypothetical protein